MIRGRVSFFAARKGERRDCWAAFLTLLSLIASHALLETARDALFLAKIPAARLPWVFLAIAALSVGTLKLHGFVARGRGPRSVLTGATLFAAAVTFGFFWLERRLGAFACTRSMCGALATFLWSLRTSWHASRSLKQAHDGFIGAGGVISRSSARRCELLSRWWLRTPRAGSSFGFAGRSASPFVQPSAARFEPDEPARPAGQVGAVLVTRLTARVAARFVATVSDTLRLCSRAPRRVVPRHSSCSPVAVYFVPTCGRCSRTVLVAA